LAQWLGAYAARRWLGVIAVLATMLAKIALDVLKPWPMKVLVDHALGTAPLPPLLAAVARALPGGGTREGLAAWSVASTVALFLVGWALGVATAFANIGLGQRMVYDLASDLFDHLQRLSLQFHRRKSVGDSIRRITSDCGCVSTIVKDTLLPLVTSIVSLVAMLSILWRMDSRLTLLSLAVVPWIAFVVHRYLGPIVERSYEAQQAEGRMYDIVEQTLYAIPVVQAFGREPDADARFARATGELIEASVAESVVGLKLKVLVGGATTLGTAAILWLGVATVQGGGLSAGQILVFLAYLGSLYGPLESIMSTPATTQAAAGSARRVLEILETKRDVDDRPGAHALTAVTGHVRFEHVTFGYQRGRPVLRDVSFEVRPGETVALVGASGGGKTTLASLVPRFYDPWSGRVLVDGHDVREVGVTTLRSQVAIVLQEPFLFPLTIAENIAYGRPQADRRAIEIAAHAANAHTFIERLPAGYDTLVGERGATLSGGERQRISIARALLKNAPILILDEPTSATDAETEHLLLQALERLKQGRTTLIIAHRLSTVRNATCILVIQSGAITESGGHEELLARGGVYARLHRLQFEGGLADRS